MKHSSSREHQGAGLRQSAVKCSIVRCRCSRRVMPQILISRTISEESRVSLFSRIVFAEDSASETSVRYPRVRCPRVLVFYSGVEDHCLERARKPKRRTSLIPSDATLSPPVSAVERKMALKMSTPYLHEMVERLPARSSIIHCTDISDM